MSFLTFNRAMRLATCATVLLATFAVTLTQAFAVNPFETALQDLGATKSSQIVNSTYSSNDGNPNPFNPVVNNIQGGIHPAQFFAFTTTSTAGWNIKVTKGFYGLSDLAAYNSFGFVDANTNVYHQMLAQGAATGTSSTWTPGNVNIYPVCVTTGTKYRWSSYADQPLPMIVTAKVNASATSAKYWVYCEDEPGGDYDYNDHGYIVEVWASQCSDGIDNDGDGAIDYPADFSCTSPDDNDETNPKAQCQDGIDNDNDGATDFPADFSCSSAQDNDETNPKAQCQDGIDNDGDGAIDFPADFGCSSKQDNDEGNPKAQCQDGIDNDGDGATDFPADFSCSSNQDNDETNPKAQCQDGIDNDGDGAIDYPADFSCTSKQDNDEGDVKAQCQDGIDNDGDGATDFPADFSCSSNQDNDETNPKAQCQDGLDNDGDGAVDLADFGCTSPQDNDEANPKAQCQDGIDNDGDGATDFPADFSCSSNQDNDETNPMAQCQDGIDNDSDGAIDYPADFGCSSKQDNDEGNPKAQCQDGLDNDGDGLVDMNDPGCASPQDNDETNGNSPVTLNAECITDNGNGTFTASFGYNNLTASTVTITDNLPSGSINAFSPAPSNRGQPAVFQPGSHPAAFTAVFVIGSSLTWTVQATGLARVSATAASTAPHCAPIISCTETSLVGVQSSLDQIAIDFAALTGQAADFIARNPSMTKSQRRAAQVDATRAKARANLFVTAAHNLLLEFPKVIVTCPDGSGMVCSTIDRFNTIQSLTGLYAKQYSATRRFTARGNFNTSGKTNRMDPLVKQAKALRKAADQNLATLPRFATECK